ncbi:MAG: DUF2975 domain-containing protein [Rikenellaceae bacterium]
MKDKKSIAKRLMVLYISFILVIVLAIVGRLLPDIRAGLAAGNMISSMVEPTDSQYNNIYVLTPIKFEPFTTPIPIVQGDSTINISAYNDNASLIIKECSEETSLAINAIGNHPIYYITSLLISIVCVWMLVLIARIILSLRRSMIEEHSVDKSNVKRVRWIGGILIGSELAGAIMAWRVNLHAAQLLTGSELNVDTSFSPDYWLIMLGILILFMGELFAITHSLSEEQKLTI